MARLSLLLSSPLPLSSRCPHLHPALGARLVHLPSHLLGLSSPLRRAAAAPHICSPSTALPSHRSFHSFLACGFPFPCGLPLRFARTFTSFSTDSSGSAAAEGKQQLQPSPAAAEASRFPPLSHSSASSSSIPSSPSPSTSGPIAPNIASASASTASNVHVPNPPTPSSSASSSSSSSSTPSASPTRRRVLYLVLGAGAVFALSLAIISYTVPSNPINRFAYEVYVYCYAAIRVSRDVLTAALMVSDYAWHLWGLPEGEARQAKLDELHWRNAKRLRDLFNANGGVFIKFGQHLAQMGYLIPDPYVEVMQSMLHQAPTSPFDEVQHTITQQLGRPIDEVFASLSPIPVASASLAQVHFGVLLSGEEVAVKVQHRFLRHTVESDIRAVQAIVKLVQWIAPAFNYNWLADEMATSLPKEVNFLLEADNAERCAAMFKGRDDLLIPRIHREYSTPMVLTMSRMRGVMVSDVQGIRALGLRLSDCSQLVAEVFSSMMFVHGFVHADPHPGNVFVCRHPTHPHLPALVLLDHGLYSEITPEFRLLYARLWKALITADTAAVKLYAQQCGAGELYGLFAAMLTRRPWQEVGRTRLQQIQGHQPIEREQLQEWAATYGLELQGLLARVPKSMILLLKTNECLRHIDTCLGSDYSSVTVMARYCQRAINEARFREVGGWRATLDNAVDSAAMEVRIACFHALMSLSSALRSLRAYTESWLHPAQFRMIRALRRKMSRRNRDARPAIVSGYNTPAVDGQVS